MKACIPLFLLLFSCSSTDNIYEWDTDQNYQQGQVVFLELDDSIALNHVYLQDDKKSFSIPIQRIDGGEACFVPLDDIPAGTTLQIVKGEPQEEGVDCHIRQTDDFILVNIGDQEVAKYAIETQRPPDTLPAYYKRSGFIHPLRTRFGTTITDGFPRGHTHQHGLFNAWTRTHFRDTFIDFWNPITEVGYPAHLKVICVHI